MDFTRSLLSLIFLVIVLSQVLPTSQIILDDDFDDCWDFYRKSKSVTVVAFERIAKPLRDSGPFAIMTSVLERNLHSITPRCGEFLFFVDRRNRFTIFDTNEENNKTVTLFVPMDEAIRFGEGISLGNQVVMSKVDKEAFKSGSLSKGSELAVYNRYAKSELLVTDVSADKETVSIHGVNVTQWEIYNDGHVIVHGTEDFFQLGRGRFQDRINTDVFEIV